MISSTKDLFRLSTLLTIVSGSSILLAALPLLSLSPHIYVTIVLIVFVKILLIFSVMDYSLAFPGPLAPYVVSLAHLRAETLSALRPPAEVDEGAFLHFGEVIGYVLLFPGMA